VIQISDNTPSDDYLDELVGDLIGLTDDDVDQSWREHCAKHIEPCRLVVIGFGQEIPTVAERDHLKDCKACCSEIQQYRESEQSGQRGAPQSNGHSPLFQGDLTRRNSSQKESDNGRTPLLHSLHNGKCANVPASLRDELYLDGPVVFPDNEVALHSWQFGRLSHLQKVEPHLADVLIETIAEHARSLNLFSNNSETLLVCFGTAMHQCGVRLAAKLSDNGSKSPHVVLAHDFYSPSLVCDPNELNGADVVILVDVVRTGGLLGRLMSTCSGLRPRRVRGLCIIDQSDCELSNDEHLHLWKERRDDRISLDEFLRSASLANQKMLRFFEPNEECALEDDTRPSPQQSENTSRCPIEIDSDLQEFIHITGAMKCDYPICGKRYPFVVNVLDLLKRNSDSCRFVISRAVRELWDLSFQRTCLAYHAGRTRRAGVIANLLSSATGWSAIPIGTKGPTFALTDQQARHIACFDNVVIVDAAVRTGETLSAIARSLSKDFLSCRPHVIAFCVLNALSSRSEEELSAALNVEIRTLFNVPLAPPTEQVRHWANVQKATIGEKLGANTELAAFKSVLANYCDNSAQSRRPRKAVSSLSETRELIANAINDAQLPLRGVPRIERACREGKPHWIRHLSIDEVVHDSKVQGLLKAVMFNSLRPRFKESAAIALSAARNYEWLNMDWLKCNEPFLQDPSDAWKSIVLIECQMKLSGYKDELQRFRDTTSEYREIYAAKTVQVASSQRTQLSLFSERSESSDGPISHAHNSEQLAGRIRMQQRLDTFVDVAR
jgi:hypothetical protein